MSEFAKVDCLTTVYPIGQSWVGKSKSGDVKFFNSLQDYKQYLTNLAASGRVCPDASVPIATRPPDTTARTYPTGFMEFLPRDENEQRKYSAMSPYWQGQEETQRAVDRGDFAEEAVFVYKRNNK